MAHGIPLNRLCPNTDHQLPIHIPAVLRILRGFRQALSIPILLLLTLYHLPDSCPTDQTILVPWLAVNWKRSLRRVVEDL